MEIVHVLYQLLGESRGYFGMAVCDQEKNLNDLPWRFNNVTYYVAFYSSLLILYGIIAKMLFQANKLETNLLVEIVK